MSEEVSAHNDRLGNLFLELPFQGRNFQLYKYFEPAQQSIPIGGSLTMTLKEGALTHVIFRCTQEADGKTFRVLTVGEGDAAEHRLPQVWGEALGQMLDSYSFGEVMSFEVNERSERWVDAFANQPRLQVEIKEEKGRRNAYVSHKKHAA